MRVSQNKLIGGKHKPIERISMTEEPIQYKRGKPNKNVLPHHTNLGRQEIQTRDIKVCTTITQIETSNAPNSGSGNL
jgi:phage antirepressor YoqD-like protein